MGDTLKPIKPLDHITKRIPIPEKVMDVAGWFKTETMELTFGEYTGRPDEFVDLHKSDLIYYIANGWYVDSVIERGGKGYWASGAVASANQSGEAHAINAATSDAESSTSGSSESSHSSATSEHRSGSDANTYGRSSSSNMQDGGPYWAVWTKIRLKRRKMQSENVLKDMITDFTKAYNEGREVNNARYDELVGLYALMLSRTEDEGNAFSSALSVEDFKPLADMVIQAVKEALAKFAKSVEDIPDDWMKSRIEEINRKFDALVSQKRSEMISNGTYNGTVWPSVESGIERDRQSALTDLKDTMVDGKIEAYGKIATITADIGQKLLDCEIRLIEASKAMLLGPTQVRNEVFKWMLDFMERRDDDYPGLDAVANVASQLGYADGAASMPTS